MIGFTIGFLHRGENQMDKVKEITVEILISIRDEIKQLRKDTNDRFEQMDKRFEQMDNRLEHIENDIRAIVSHFDRDYMLLANKVGELEGRFDDHVSSHPH
jgi:phosphopantetheine adenylyltransferase